MKKKNCQKFLRRSELGWVGLSRVLISWLKKTFISIHHTFRINNFRGIGCSKFLKDCENRRWTSILIFMFIGDIDHSSQYFSYKYLFFFHQNNYTSRLRYVLQHFAQKMNFFVVTYQKLKFYVTVLRKL